jgi:hypothetical protein
MSAREGKGKACNMNMPALAKPQMLERYVRAPAAEWHERSTAVTALKHGIRRVGADKPSLAWLTSTFESCRLFRSQAGQWQPNQTASLRKQPMEWSLTMPTACIQA